MARRELLLRAKLKLPQGLIERAHPPMRGAKAMGHKQTSGAKAQVDSAGMIVQSRTTKKAKRP
jgi:hypothetical protein